MPINDEDTMAKHGAWKELLKTAETVAKLWEKLRGAEKEKPFYNPADQMVAVCNGLVGTLQDLDKKSKAVASWQSGAEPDGTPESPEVVVTEFRFQFLGDFGEVSAVLSNAMRCKELVAMDGFEGAFVATVSLAGATCIELASIKRE